MRLWHDNLIPYLPRLQLLGQHRECCAMRGKGWGMNHASVRYVWSYPLESLYIYHLKILVEMKARGYFPDPRWLELGYRGKNAPLIPAEWLISNTKKAKNRASFQYKEHNQEYLIECIKNLKEKLKKAPKDKYPPEDINRFNYFCSTFGEI